VSDEQVPTKPPTQPPPGPTGLLIVDKPLGLTSMAVCRAVRGRLRRGGAPKSVKVGHGGTLDPLATGIVVVLIGKATRLCDVIMAGEKRYLAEVDLSRKSPSDDHERESIQIHVLRPPSLEEVRRACDTFVGEIDQVPPAHSAIWVDGTRAYHHARKGRDPGLSARRVVIHSIEILEYTWPLVKLDVRTGKGVYIRSLARDVGAALGLGGMLHSLRRTQVGEFTIERAAALDDVPDPLGQEHLLPIPAKTA
jgi:tRNA pseudouridine55 synthase